MHADSKTSSWTNTSGGVTKPKLVRCVDTAGVEHFQLVKNGDDLRSDHVVEQVFNLMSRVRTKVTALSVKIILFERIVPEILVTWCLHLEIWNILCFYRTHCSCVSLHLQRNLNSVHETRIVQRTNSMYLCSRIYWWNLALWDLLFVGFCGCWPLNVAYYCG